MYNFPAISILKELDTVLNPKKLRNVPQESIATHGLPSLDKVIERMSLTTDNGFEPERAKNDFLAFKIHARASSTKSFVEFAEELLAHYSDQYPDFAILTSYFLSVPLNSASCERGFSAQNLVKTKLRNRLTDKRHNELLRISINGPDFQRFDYVNAAQNFRKMKNRIK